MPHIYEPGGAAKPQQLDVHPRAGVEGIAPLPTTCTLLTQHTACSSRRFRKGLEEAKLCHGLPAVWGPPAGQPCRALCSGKHYIKPVHRLQQTGPHTAAQNTAVHSKVALCGEIRV